MMSGNRTEQDAYAGGKDREREKQIVFFIDNEKFETEQATLTVRTLLVEYAKEDPDQVTLAIRNGSDFTKYKDPQESVVMKNGMKFVVFHNSPTPVS